MREGTVVTFRPWYVGYGLLEAWVFVSILCRGGAPGAGSGVQYALGSLSVAGGFLVMMALRHRIGRISAHPAVGGCIAVASFAGSLASAWASPLGALVLAMATGVLNAWLWLMWGEVYSLLDTEGGEHVSLWSAAALAAAVILLCLLPRDLAMAVSSALLLVSYGCFLLAVRQLGRQGAPQEGAIRSGTVAAAPKIRVVAGLLMGLGIPNAAVFLFVGAGFTATGMGEAVSSSVSLGLVAFFLLFFAALRGISSFDLVPLLTFFSGCAIAVACALGLGAPVFLSNALIVAAWLSVNMLSWLYLSRLYREGFSDVMGTFGTGQVILFATSTVGYGVGAVVQPLFLRDAQFAAQACLAVAAVLFLAVVLGRRWERRAPASGAAAARPAGADEDAPVLAIADERGLTPREKEVLLLLLKGRSAPYIRNELCISESTVRTHIKHIHAKFGVERRQDLLSLVEERRHNAR